MCLQRAVFLCPSTTGKLFLGNFKMFAFLSACVSKWHVRKSNYSSNYPAIFPSINLFNSCISLSLSLCLFLSFSLSLSLSFSLSFSLYFLSLFIQYVYIMSFNQVEIGCPRPPTSLTYTWNTSWPKTTWYHGHSRTLKGTNVIHI